MSDLADAMAPSSMRTGNVLHGKYRLEHELGRGAMGTVWSAVHLSLDQRVAIKVISSEYADSAEAIQRFHTEAKAAAKLRSRYVVQVYDDGETPEGLPYIVMEYLEGESLEDRISRESDIPLAEAVRIATHVGRALSRAHARGIVHRDLKPGNIFITRNEEDDMGWVAKVLDFGIAKLDDNREKSTTKTGTVLGTPLFMSAEQVRGASTVDARADLYSLGMVFYNMLTGSYAFEGSSFGDLLVSICTDPLPKLSDRAPWAPHSLEQWFQKACARDVAARFASADEMIDELYAAANLSFDGRMSFSDENSSLHQLALPQSGIHSYRATDTGNEAKHAYAIAATQQGTADELAANTGDASVHTIMGVPEKKRWLMPASIAAGVALVAAVAIGIGASDGAQADANDRTPLSAAAELQSGTKAAKAADSPRVEATLAATEPATEAKADAMANEAEDSSEDEGNADPAKAADESSDTATAAAKSPPKPAVSKGKAGPATKVAKKPTPQKTSAPAKPAAKKPSTEVDIGF